MTHPGVTKFFILSLLVMLSACTSSKAIRTPVIDSLTVKQAIDSGETGKLIRWGGKIVSTETKSDHTIIEIVDRPLTRYGVPKVTDKTGGRFLARSNEFIEPENLKSGRYITVSGQLLSHENGKIGEHDYTYPVVQINEYKIWPVNTSRRSRYYNSPYWHDPYWGYYPYYHNHFYYRHRYRHW